MSTSNFSTFKHAIQRRLVQMQGTGELFVTDVDKDELWELYLSIFPDGTNPIFRERTEHDCQCCRQFIRNYGAVVAVTDHNSLMTIWDVFDYTPDRGVPSPYHEVAEAMSAYVASRPIKDVFRAETHKLGTDHNRDAKAEIVWDHFYCEVPKSYVLPSHRIPTTLGELRANRDVAARGLAEISLESIDLVLELIAQNSLYRGAEHLKAVQDFQAAKLRYLAVHEALRDNFVWRESARNFGLRIRNTVIGTLLTDLSAGMELDAAVRQFESKVAPANYKRPTALVTQAMVKAAQQTVEELGIERALYRRHANLGDITINNLLFAGHETKVALNVFDDLKAEAARQNLKDLSRVEEVSIDTFISEILPRATQLELQFEGRHAPNLMSLIAPAHPDAPNILKWSNNFSWAYAGSLADSIAEKVKRAGGNVEGHLRFSLEWFNHDDLDIHVAMPNGREIYYVRKIDSQSGGRLDVDMNAGSGTSRTPVENVAWPDKSRIQNGRYQVYIHQFQQREAADVGFNVEAVCGMQKWAFSYDKRVAQNERVKVAEFEYRDGEMTLVQAYLPESQATKEVWGIQTNQAHRVSAVLKSPNHWDENQVGNLHWFFLLEGCANPEPIRGLFNEYLMGSLDKHRKVFEVLGSKLMVQPQAGQLSGLGFSSTKRDHVLCKVSGSFNRVVKIVF